MSFYLAGKNATQTEQLLDAIADVLSFIPDAKSSRERVDKAARLVRTFAPLVREVATIEGYLADEIRIREQRSALVHAHVPGSPKERFCELELLTETVEIAVDDGPMPVNGTVTVSVGEQSVECRYELVNFSKGDATYSIAIVD